MEYVAKHYIKVDGRMICPGELFQKEYDAEAERRLIEAGFCDAAVVGGVMAAQGIEPMAAPSSMCSFRRGRISGWWAITAM